MEYITGGSCKRITLQQGRTLFGAPGALPGDRAGYGPLDVVNGLDVNKLEMTDRRGQSEDRCLAQFLTH